MGDIVTVNFRGDDLYGFKQDDGVFLALKPMVEAMGLDWSGQLQRVKRDPILAEGMVVMPIPFGRGGQQEAVCIRLDLVNGWLFTIDSSRIKDDEVRQRVQVYQRECYQVLHDHFAGKRQPQIANDAEPNDSPSMNERRSLVAEARQTFGALAARQLWFNQNLPIVPAMIAAGQNDVTPDLFHYGMVNTAAE